MEFCICCGQSLSKDEIGINKKLVDPELTDFMCLECLARDFETDVDTLLIKIEEFKEEGCTLFL